MTCISLYLYLHSCAILIPLCKAYALYILYIPFNVYMLCQPTCIVFIMWVHIWLIVLFSCNIFILACSKQHLIVLVHLQQNHIYVDVAEF